MTETAGAVRPAAPGRRVAALAMIGSAACWGFATVMSRDLLSTIPAPRLLVVQLAASVAALLLLAAPRFPWRCRGRRFGLGALAGLLEPGLAYAVGLAGLTLTTAGRASVISATEPALIVLLSWLVFRRRPGARLLIAIALAAAGLVLVSGAGLADGGPDALAGDLLIVLATLFAAGYVIASSVIAADFPAATLAAAQQMVGLGFALLLLALLGATGRDAGAFRDIPAPLLAYAALSGVVQYALAFWLYLTGLRHLSAGAAGLWLALTPVFGLVGAWAWLGEAPGGATIAGAALIIAAIAFGGATEGGNG